MVSDKILSKNFSDFSRTYYHGTNSDNFNLLKDGISIDICGEYTDFGKGFYLTSNFQQASKHATRRAKKNEDSYLFSN